MIKLDLKLDDELKIKFDTPDMLMHQHYAELTAKELLEALFLLKREQEKQLNK